MSKPIALCCILALFLVFSFCCSAAARPTPTLLDAAAPAQFNPKSQAVEEEGVQVDESCQGIGEDECLMRRSLNAHLDYIYTQNVKH